MAANDWSYALLQNISRALALLLVVNTLPTSLAKINPGRCYTATIQGGYCFQERV